MVYIILVLFLFFAFFYFGFSWSLVTSSCWFLSFILGGLVIVFIICKLVLHSVSQWIFGTWSVVLAALVGSSHPRFRADVGAKFNLTLFVQNFSISLYGCMKAFSFIWLSLTVLSLGHGSH